MTAGLWEPPGKTRLDGVSGRIPGSANSLERAGCDSFLVDSSSIRHRSSVPRMLDGKYQSFTAIAAVIGESPPAATPLQFRVLGDSKLLWASRNFLQCTGDQEQCTVSIRGVKLLTLEVLCRGDNRFAHAAWIEPAVSTVARQSGGGSFAGDDPTSGDSSNSSASGEPGFFTPQPAESAANRLPVPDDATQQKLLVQLKDRLKENYSHATTPEKRQSLRSAELDKLSSNKTEDNATRYVMLTQSRQTSRPSRRRRVPGVGRRRRDWQVGQAVDA